MLGKSSGGLYAGATAGGDVSAAAGIAGTKSVSGSFGGSYAGASAAGKSEYVAHVEKPVVVEKEVHTHTVPVVQKTYVERTIIPNYVEKKVQVPSYVEKTIRVPTVIEKTVRVPAAPTIIEKTIEAPSQPVVAEGKVTVVEKAHIAPVHSGVVVHKYG